MKAFFIALVLGVFIGATGTWYFMKGRTQPGVREAQDATAHALERTGQVIRHAASDVGAAVADASADARITGAIKAKYVADRDLNALSIAVNTTAGHVTLAGTVGSPDLIRKAMLIALETEGVREVTSTLQTKK